MLSAGLLDSMCHLAAPQLLDLGWHFVTGLDFFLFILVKYS